MSEQAATALAPGRLERTLRTARDAGRKLLVPYVTGGLGSEWIEVVRACAAAGVDAIEIGIPFSDPVMDGPTIQAASQLALEGGATPASILLELRGADVGVPLAVMTYYNLIAHMGERRAAAELADAGVSAAILPDLPLEEAGEWVREADTAGIETVFLVAPTTPDERLERIAARSRGFLYAIGLLGVTGERENVANSAMTLARRCKAVTDLPVLVGVGVSTPEHARELAQVADGVVVGSALIRRLLEGGGPEATRTFLTELREGLDSA